jgi:ribonuclease HII
LAARAKQSFRCLGSFERELRACGHARVAGVDEAGRGSLFGPVFAAAVILSPERPIYGLRDSKVLDAARREELAALIRERAVSYAVASIDAFLIDCVNIYRASCLAMKRAIEQLNPAPDSLLLDAVHLDMPLPQMSLIHGDARSQAIAAASILAKTSRDACLRQWDEVFPQYGFRQHKGYGTPEHLAALDLHGPTAHHRFSFAPVKLVCGWDGGALGASRTHSLTVVARNTLQNRERERVAFLRSGGRALAWR